MQSTPIGGGDGIQEVLRGLAIYRRPQILSNRADHLTSNRAAHFIGRRRLTESALQFELLQCRGEVVMWFKYIVGIPIMWERHSLQDATGWGGRGAGMRRGVPRVGGGMQRRVIEAGPLLLVDTERTAVQEPSQQLRLACQTDDTYWCVVPSGHA